MRDRRAAVQHVLLHNFTDENVELAVALFANFGDFVRARFITGDSGAARRWSVSGGKINNDAKVPAAAGKFQNGVGDAGLGAENSPVWLGEINYELSLQINALTGETAICEVLDVAKCDQPPDRHFTRSKSFPGAAAGSRSECVFRRSGEWRWRSRRSGG